MLTHLYNCPVADTRYSIPCVMGHLHTSNCEWPKLWTHSIETLTRRLEGKPTSAWPRTGARASGTSCEACASWTRPSNIITCLYIWQWTLSGTTGTLCHPTSDRPWISFKHHFKDLQLSAPPNITLWRCIRGSTAKYTCVKVIAWYCDDS